MPDPEGIINQGKGNKTARAVQIYRGDRINRAALSRLLRIVSNNRAGGWRRMQGASG